MLAHHPINTSGGPRRHAINSNDASSADLDRIARVLRAAERAGTVLPGPHPLWATEMWWDSNPPTSPGSPPGRQARWIEDALYQAWKDGASVVINLAIRDFTTSGLQGGTGSGIFFADGRPKPSYTAFRFPFVTDRKNRRMVRAWGKAPAGGKLVIQRKRGKRWRAVKKLRVRQGQVFLTKLRLSGRQPPTRRGRRQPQPQPGRSGRSWLCQHFHNRCVQRGDTSTSEGETCVRKRSW